MVVLRHHIGDVLRDGELGLAAPPVVRTHDEPERKPGAWMAGRSAGRGHRRGRPAADLHRYRPSVVREQRPGVSE